MLAWLDLAELDTIVLQVAQLRSLVHLESTALLQILPQTKVIVQQDITVFLEQQPQHQQS